MESMNEKGRRLRREKALRDAIDKIVECASKWPTDPAYKDAREEAVALILKCI